MLQVTHWLNLATSAGLMSSSKALRVSIARNSRVFCGNFNNACARPRSLRRKEVDNNKLAVGSGQWAVKMKTVPATYCQLPTANLLLEFTQLFLLYSLRLRRATPPAPSVPTPRIATL